MGLHRLLFSILVWSAAPAGFAAQNAAPPRPSEPRVRLAEARVAPGGILMLVAEGEGVAGRPLWVKFGDQRYPFFPHPSAPAERAAVFVPIPFDSASGPGELAIEREAGTLTQRVPYVITRSTYPVIQVTIPKHIAQPSEADKARFQREREEVKKILAEPATVMLWKAPFVDPVAGKITCLCGVKRMFNGTLQSTHKGLDLRAATGTPVHAAASGTVRLGKELFYGGNVVILDHGLGLFSSYAHLSRIQVQAGQAVQAGQVLGLSGATGRVNAPHLHWGASIAAVDVDPRQARKCMALLTAEGLKASAAHRGKASRRGRK